MTDIGAAFRQSWPIRILALLIGVSIVATDLAGTYGAQDERMVYPLLGICALLGLAGKDLASLGLALPQPSAWWWVRTTAIVGTGFVVLVVAIAGVLYALGYVAPFGAPPPLGEFLWDACVVAPLVEEPIYRLALCAPLVAIVGRWPTIITSGVVFAWLHYRYGVLAPDNALAGLLLGWAYLRSGSLLVPILLHALGNALVGLFLVFIAPTLSL